MEYTLSTMYQAQRQSAWRPLRYLFGALGVGVFVVATIITIVSTIQPRGLRLVTVPDQSMGSVLTLGSLAVVVPANKYQAGQIVAFESPGVAKPVVHRIIGASTNGTGPTYFQTRGDDVAHVDRVRITQPAILGQVAFTLPFLGYLLTAVQTTLGLIVLVIVPITLLIGRVVQTARRRWRDGQYQTVFHTGPPLVTRYDA